MKNDVENLKKLYEQKMEEYNIKCKSLHEDY